MSPPDVKSKILEEFQCENFMLLECTKGRLFKGKDDELTASLAVAIRGALYLCQKQKVSNLVAA